jgi:hypothetical protein
MTKKGICFFILICVIFIGWGLHQPKSIEEAKNVFDSSLYANYKAKIQAFVQQHHSYQNIKLAKVSDYNFHIQQLILFIEAISDKPVDMRVFHETFLKKIREVAQLSTDLPYEQDSKKFLEDLINWLYLTADLQLEQSKFLYQYVSPPQQDLYSYLLQTQEQLHNYPQFCSIQHEASFEDQFLQGNLPSLITVIDQTKLIRLGQPVCHSRMFWSLPKISPEFLLFLKKQPHHFYVNLMKRKGVEGIYTKALESLGENLNNLTIITLDKNSSFYWQDATDYPDILSAQEFKEIFLGKMLLDKGCFFWSKHIDKITWKTRLHSILDDIHYMIFKNSATLNRTERKDFIEITYLKILDVIKDKCKPSSMNITCRQGMDRGPSLMVLWMLKKGVLDDPKVAANLLLTPPLLIRNRSSHRSRIEKLISTAKRLDHHDIKSSD